jgi:hypothetical protein
MDRQSDVHLRFPGGGMAGTRERKAGRYLIFVIRLDSNNRGWWHPAPDLFHIIQRLTFGIEPGMG